MNENDFDVAARAWLDDGPARMSDHAVLSTLEEIHATRQRRATWPTRRATPVSIFARVATAAALVAVVGFLAITIVPRQLDGWGVGGPSPSPTATQALDFPALTTTFVSPRNGFSIMHPDGAALTPAKQLLGDLRDDAGFDIVETGLAAIFKGASTEIDVENGFLVGEPSGISIDEAVDMSYAEGDCMVPRSQQAEITIDGQSGRVAEACPNEIGATVVAGGRLYLFKLLHDRSDARAVFDAFVATIDLRPETAIDYPGLTSTFVSPTYGFSFGYHDRGAPGPGPDLARERWDPATQPPIDKAELDVATARYRDRFDVWDTGRAAVFKSASAEIPDDVSIDAWVDAAVVQYLPDGCYVPRGQQAEIFVDGQSGRISEDCPDTVVATVVAGGRLYLFMMSHDRTDARAFFDTWVATIDLRPEDAAVPSSTP
jgi:hypothetical protein